VDATPELAASNLREAWDEVYGKLEEERGEGLWIGVTIQPHEGYEDPEEALKAGFEQGWALFEAVESRVDDVEGESRKAEEEYKELEEERDKLKEELEESEKQVEELRSELTAERAEVQESTETTTSQESKIINLEEEVTKLQGEVSDLEERLAAAEALADELQSVASMNDSSSVSHACRQLTAALKGSG
jgi:chromosome segregation ATPase